MRKVLLIGVCGLLFPASALAFENTTSKPSVTIANCAVVIHAPVDTEDNDKTWTFEILQANQPTLKGSLGFGGDRSFALQTFGQSTFVEGRLLELEHGETTTIKASANVVCGIPPPIVLPPPPIVTPPPPAVVPPPTIVKPPVKHPKHKLKKCRRGFKRYAPKGPCITTHHTIRPKFTG